MVIDTFRNAATFSSSEVWTQMIEFLRSLPPEVKDGKYGIRGEDIYAIVMSYTTRDLAQGILEAHRNYVDVQLVLAGSERCRWFPVESLKAMGPYDEGKDAQFFIPPPEAPVQFTLAPGLYAVFFPGDAHMTSLAATPQAGEEVKKVVVKIRADLLGA